MIHWGDGTDCGQHMALICHCAGVRESAIVRSIRDGCSTIDDLRLVCGAAADCGGCEMSLHDLLDQHLVAFDHSVRDQPVAMRFAS